MGRQIENKGIKEKLNEKKRKDDQKKGRYYRENYKKAKVIQGQQR